ncbi:MAG: hypothetical protein IJT53_04745 [Prevotella sp.]|nr:hypothetical protein [Prevotella sp.]
MHRKIHPRQQGAAGKIIEEPCGATSQSLCQQSADFCHRQIIDRMGVLPVRKSRRLADNGSIALTSARP